MRYANVYKGYEHGIYSKTVIGLRRNKIWQEY